MRQNLRGEHLGDAVTVTGVVQKVVGQLHDVFGVLAQGRKLHAQHPQPVVQIRAVFPALHQFFQGPVGRRDNPDIDGDALLSADAVKALVV